MNIKAWCNSIKPLVEDGSNKQTARHRRPQVESNQKPTASRNYGTDIFYSFFSHATLKWKRSGRE
jgi:hypothetical protein